MAGRIEVAWSRSFPIGSTTLDVVAFVDELLAIADSNVRASLVHDNAKDIGFTVVIAAD